MIYTYRAYILINVSSYKLENTLVFNHPPANILVNREIYVIIAGLDAGLHSPWCGAGLNIEVCGAVRAPALDDGAVRCGCGPIHCGAVRSRSKLLGPSRALVAEAGEICTHLNEGLELPVLLSPNHHPQNFF